MDSYLYTIQENDNFYYLVTQLHFRLWGISTTTVYFIFRAGFIHDFKQNVRQPFHLSNFYSSAISRQNLFSYYNKYDQKNFFVQPKSAYFMIIYIAKVPKSVSEIN